MRVVKNTCGQSDFSILKLAMSQEKAGQTMWFFISDIEWRKVKDDLKTFSWVRLKMLSANKILKFLKQHYLKKDVANKPDILEVGRDSRKVNGNFKNVGKLWS